MLDGFTVVEQILGIWNIDENSEKVCAHDFTYLEST